MNCGFRRVCAGWTAAVLAAAMLGAGWRKTPAAAEELYQQEKELALAALASRLEEEGEAIVLLRSYDTEDVYVRDTAFSYDNALAAMAFLSEGKRCEAEALLNAFVFAAEYDRSLQREKDWGNWAEEWDSSTVRRIRNAYAAGSIGASETARLPGWYDEEKEAWFEDRYQVGSNTGNTAYVALALMQYYSRFVDERYLKTARALMNWVLETCSDDGEGFTAGFDGWEESDPPAVEPLTYKSTEHNLDAFAAFSALYGITGEEKYQEAARSALCFVDSMYDPEEGLFRTGTMADGITPNTGATVLDAQVWCALALGSAFEPYEKALDVVETMKTEEGGYPFCLENKNGGWWAEGTAYTALMYRIRGDMERYKKAMNALVSIQLSSGLFPAATVANLSTGTDLSDGTPWEYSDDPHIAPTAWFIMAVNGFNPYVLP